MIRYIVFVTINIWNELCVRFVASGQCIFYAQHILLQIKLTEYTTVTVATSSVQYNFHNCLFEIEALKSSHFNENKHHLPSKVYSIPLASGKKFLLSDVVNINRILNTKFVKRQCIVFMFTTYKEYKKS